MNHLYQQWENAPENLPRIKSTGLFESSQGNDVNIIENMLNDSEFPHEEIDKFLEALKKESNTTAKN